MKAESVWELPKCTVRSQGSGEEDLTGLWGRRKQQPPPGATLISWGRTHRFTHLSRFLLPSPRRMGEAEWRALARWRIVSSLVMGLSRLLQGTDGFASPYAPVAETWNQVVASYFRKPSWQGARTNGDEHLIPPFLPWGSVTIDIGPMRTRFMSSDKLPLVVLRKLKARAFKRL